MPATTWIYIIGAVALAALANYVSALWGAADNKWTWTFIAMIVLSPLVFISFGLLAARTGMALAAGVVDALLTIVSMAIGLLVLQEWHRISTAQVFGMALSALGVCLMVFFPKP